MITSPAPQAQIASPTSEHALRINSRTAYATVIAIILCIYSYPALRTALKTESLRLPPVSAPDMGLYLSISHLESSHDGFALNPYYHIPMPYPAAYLKFRFGPWLFGKLNQVLAGRIWVSLFVWNLWWWGLLSVAAAWLFSRFLPQPTLGIVLVGVSWLTLFSFEAVSRALTAWIHSPQMWPPGWLPYIRPFSPQVIMPLFLCYVGLQIRALNKMSFPTWATMACLQFVVFTAFPYTTLMMAGTTFVAVLWLIFSGAREKAWREAIVFMFLCAVPDVVFALHGSAGARLSFPDQTSLIHFQTEVFGRVIGKLWILTVILVIAIIASRKIRPQVKWPLVGLGLSNVLFVMSDAFVSERVFYLSDHIGYFYQPTVVILSMFLVSAYLPSDFQFRRPARIACAAIIVVCFVSGLVMAEGNYRVNLSYNLEQADLARWFARADVLAHDLVLVQFAGSAYDSCEWVPLLSDAQVLYCRNAQLALTPEQNRDVQRLREVMYLYFTGKDHEWLEQSTQFEQYGLYGELSSFRKPEERSQRVVALRQEMKPLFDRVEHSDPSIQNYFRGFRRVWIVQRRQNPGFIKQQLETYLDLGETESAGTLSVTSSVPK